MQSLALKPHRLPQVAPTLPFVRNGFQCVNEATMVQPCQNSTRKKYRCFIQLAILTIPALMLLFPEVKDRLGSSGFFPSVHRNLKHDMHSSAAKSVHGAKDALDQFVVRKKDRLFLNGEAFRFISFNVPNLHVVEDETWHRVSQWEQEDALETISRMGGQVVRIYPMSIVGGLNNGTYTHILGKGMYNEALFQDLDRLLVVAHRLEIRVIIPFIDHWEWWGGVSQFARLFNASFSDFYESPFIKAGFLDFVEYLLMRKNTLTGQLYRDDPTILAWETGNELDYVNDDTPHTNTHLSAPLMLPSLAVMDKWTSELAAFLKKRDPNHLVIDGRLLNNRDVSRMQLLDPHIDLISDHFYPNTDFSFEARLTRMLSFSKRHKPFLVGEFGMVSSQTMDALAKRVIEEAAVAGALLWSLRSHSAQGGFYWHYEYDDFWAYHYLGFDSNPGTEEKKVMAVVEKHAYAIRNQTMPAPTIPRPPKLINGSTTQAIAWQGSVGAQHYELERKEVALGYQLDTGMTASGADRTSTWQEGKWIRISNNLSDSMNPYVPFMDATAQPGKIYEYRIYAVSSAGRSAPSPAMSIHASSAASRP